MDSTEIIYSELAKWERHKLGHSMAHLYLSCERLWLIPHKVSVIDKGFNIPTSNIVAVQKSDNWLWRGAVNILLKEEIRIEFEFKVNPEILVIGMEEEVFCSKRLRLFLGSNRKQFLRCAQELGIKTET